MRQRRLTIFLIIVGFSIASSITLAYYGNQHMSVFSEKVNSEKPSYDLQDIQIITNAKIVSVLPSEDIQGFEIKISPNHDGTLLMDDPLPYLQKLYSDLGINSYWIVIDGIGINHSFEDDKIRIDFEGDVDLIQIVGIAPLS